MKLVDASNWVKVSSQSIRLCQSANSLYVFAYIDKINNIFNYSDKIRKEINLQFLL